MKIVKIISVVSILTFGLTTSVFASWWNPFSWFHKKIIPVMQVQPTPIPITQNIPPATSTPATGNIPVQYIFHTPPATTTRLIVSGVDFSVPWTDIQGSQVKNNYGRWKFKNGESISVLYSTTTTKSIWKDLPDMKKILPLDTLNDYDLEKMIWRSNVQDVSLLTSEKVKNTDDIRKGMLATIKARQYSGGDFFEFENQNGIKGLISKWNNGGKRSFVIYFYPFPGYQYEMRFATENDSVMESIVSSIKLNK